MNLHRCSPSRSLRACVALALSVLATHGLAQTQPQSSTAPTGAAPQPASAPTGAGSPALQPLAWLAGCWEGKVNQREFREEWLPLKGDVMVGASQTAMQGKTQTYEYLRLEPRADGVYYVPLPSGHKEGAFKLAGKTVDGEDEIFTFESASDEFPQRIIYRHAARGWLYAHVGGKVNGEAKEVIYPMQRVDCQTGEFLHK
jgi:hypothetical protein